MSACDRELLIPHNEQLETVKNLMKFYKNSQHLQSHKNQISKAFKEIFSKAQEEDLNLIMNAYNCFYWKPFDYLIYNKLLSYRKFNRIDFKVIVHRIIVGINCSDCVLHAIEIFKQLQSHLDLHGFIDKYLKHSQLFNKASNYHNFYSYLLPAIVSLQREDLLEKIIDNVNAETVHKVMVLKFLPHKQNSEIFQKVKDLDLNVQEILFTNICKRKEKTKIYTLDEINYIIWFLKATDNSETLKNLKYFISHLCISINAKNIGKNNCNETFSRCLLNLQTFAYDLMSVKNHQSIRKGCNLYVYLFDCIALSKYTTAYSLDPTKNIVEPKESFCYNCIKTIPCFIMDDDEAILSGFINSDNYFCFGGIFTRKPKMSRFISRERATNFYHFLASDYMDDKFNIYLEFYVDNYFGEESHELLIQTSIETLNRKSVDYEAYKGLKVLIYLNSKQCLNLGNFCELIGILEFFINSCCDAESQSGKLGERLVTCALELLLLITDSNVAESSVISKRLQYCEKVIYCNKRYAATKGGQLYKDFVARCFNEHAVLLEHYLRNKLFTVSNGHKSKLRQQYEFRVIVLELCLAAPRIYRKTLVELVLNQCSADFEALEKESSNLIVYSRLKYTVPSINALFDSATIKDLTFPYIITYFNHCFICIDFLADYQFRNSLYILFKTLTKRLLPFSDRDKNMSMDDILLLLPQLYKWAEVDGKSMMVRTQVSLMMSFLDRSNFETPFMNKSSSFCRKILNKLLVSFLKSNESAYENALNLWVKLIPRFDILRAKKYLNFLLREENAVQVGPKLVYLYRALHDLNERYIKNESNCKVIVKNIGNFSVKSSILHSENDVNLKLHVLKQIFDDFHDKNQSFQFSQLYLQDFLSNLFDSIVSDKNKLVNNFEMYAEIALFLLDFIFRKIPNFKIKLKIINFEEIQRNLVIPHFAALYTACLAQREDLTLVPLNEEQIVQLTKSFFVPSSAILASSLKYLKVIEKNSFRFFCVAVFMLVHSEFDSEVRRDVFSVLEIRDSIDLELKTIFNNFFLKKYVKPQEMLCFVKFCNKLVLNKH